MITNNPIRQVHSPDYHEGSPLRSPRDSDSTSQEWKRNRQVSRQTNGHNGNISQLQRQLNRMRRNLVSSGSETVDLSVCDISTGVEKIFRIQGEEVTS